MKKEATTIMSVFPSPNEVMSILVQVCFIKQCSLCDHDLSILKSKTIVLCFSASARTKGNNNS